MNILNKTIQTLPDSRLSSLFSVYENAPGRVTLAEYIKDNLRGVSMSFVSVTLVIILIIFYLMMKARKAQIQAEKANAAKSDFLFNMSHDIRTPMNALLGYSELMKRELTDPKLLDYQEKMEQSGNLLLSIINNVLDMAKIESGKMELDENYVQIRDIYHGVYKIFQAEAEKKGIHLEMEYEVQHEHVICDETKNREIFLNLISNAVKYTASGGAVTIRITELDCDRKDYVRIQTQLIDTGIGMSEETKKNYETYMINMQNEYNKTTVEYYNSGKVVEGTIEGKGMINWRAPLSILQMLNGDLTYDFAELTILEQFRKAELYEKISDVTYTYEKETDAVDGNGNKIKETVTDTKKVVKNPSLDDYISWCNKNFSVINQYKAAKGLNVNWNQKAFTDDEVEQIRLLYNSNSFFELFSSDFKSTYAYLNVNIGDEQLRAIYDEFLKNVGTRYLMDHSNLKYDECMDYYDCSSWVIHCLAHTGIITIPNTGAQGIYNGYCYPVNVNDRNAGDLIFLKDTYDTGEPGSISHIGIYMGTLTIDGDTDEYVIDTGGNPSGVRIRKYNNGWWNGEHFYGFGRLKQ